MIPRLKEKYNLELSGEIQKELNLSNINQIPTLEKIIINIGDGKAATDGRALESMVVERMWEFYDRFVQVVVPRIRDFRGFSTKSFGGKGNYSLGLNEQLVFPEVEYDKVRDIRGMNITICTTANDNNEGYVLLNSLGFPFREN